MNSNRLVSRAVFAASLSLAGLAAVSTPALAHRFWLLPSATTLSGSGQTVSIDGAISNDLFNPDHVAMPLDIVQVIKPDGSKGEITNAMKARHRSTFDLAVDQEGTWWVGVKRAMHMGSFQLDGETWRVGGRPRKGVKRVASLADIPAGASDLKLSEVLSTNGIFITAGVPNAEAFKVTGKGLELEAVTHPDELVSNEPGQFRFLIDGKPASGVKVTAVPGSKQFRESEMVTGVETGSDGLATINWPIPGMYWIEAEAEDTHAAEPRAASRRMSYTMVVEVVAP